MITQKYVDGIASATINARVPAIFEPTYDKRNLIFPVCAKVSITCLRATKALARLRLCAGSPEPLLVAYVISTFFSCAGLFIELNIVYRLCPERAIVSEHDLPMIARGKQGNHNRQ